VVQKRKFRARRAGNVVVLSVASSFCRTAAIPSFAVTLNITLGARWMLAQSSDFRLTSDRGIESEIAQKQVVLHYLGWSGLVCYTGVARYGAHDTAAWLESVLTHDLGDRKPTEVVSVLKNEAEVWLRKIPAKDRRHSFTLMTYQGGRPYVYVLSNCGDPDQAPFETPLDELIVTPLRVREPRCIITGWSPAVSDHQRRALTGILAHKPPPEILKRFIADVSMASAASPAAEGKIGEACVVAHLSPDGSGQMDVHGDVMDVDGNVPAQFIPTMILQGINLTGGEFRQHFEGQDDGIPRTLESASWPAQKPRKPNGEPEMTGMAVMLKGL
jgi:hypothetical protein